VDDRVDDRSKPPSKVIVNAMRAAAADAMSAAVTERVRGLLTGGRGLLVVVTSLAIDAESTGGETGETTTVGAAVAGGTSEMNHDSWSAPLAALSASLLTLGSPERMSQESGRGVGGMFTPAFVEADVDPTFTPRSDGVKVI